jgi:Holliday junction resolvase RusA-like endonuclease
MITFFVQGVPKAQPRVKFSSRGNFGRAYTPDTADDWKALVMIEAKKHFREPLEGPLRVDIEFLFPRPKSHFTSKGQLKPNSPFWHTTKPDRDNLDKCVLDALTTIGAWNDDCQVCCGTIYKSYTTHSLTGANITISTPQN